MRKLSRQTKRDLVAYSFIAPNFIGFCVFTLIPIIFAFALAFMKWDGSNPIQWAGISNFTRLWKDTFFIAAFKNTIIYCIGTVPLTMIASLALAIVLNQKVIGRGIFRTLSFFPYVASLVAITAVWKMLFHPSKGPVNNILLNVFNVPQDQLPQWFTGGLVLFSMILFSVWKYMGYYMVIYLAGLQGISSELYEAASLDGSYHPVDSSEMSFKTAASLAYKEGMKQAEPTLLEPVGLMSVTVPDECTGDIMGEVTKRRGRVLGMNPDDDGLQVVEAEVPVAEMQDFTTFLRQLTQGRGYFTFEFVRYETLPQMLENKVIEQAKALGNFADED